jgi:hypothetical protein
LAPIQISQGDSGAAIRKKNIEGLEAEPQILDSA